MKKKFNCLQNNFYFLKKAFRVSPMFLLLSAGMRIMMGLRTSFMDIYFLSYVIFCVENRYSLSHVMLFVLISFLVISLTYVIQARFDNIYKPVCTEKIARSLQHTIFEKARFTDLEMYDTEDYYTSVVLANYESGDRVLAVVENLLNLLEAAVAVITIIGYSLTIDGIVPIVVMVSFGISFFMNHRIAYLRVHYDNEMKKADKECSMLHRILYLPEYVKDIRLTRIRDQMLQLYHSVNAVKDGIIRKNGVKISRLSAWKTILSASVCIDFLVPLYLVYRILIQKTLLVSQFVAILNGCNQLQLKLEDIAKEIGIFYQNGKLIERYRRVEFHPNKIEQSACGESESVSQPFRALELSDVSFHYPSGDFALQNISLTIQQGEKIAIVGKNGSGKSSLIKLLLRFYDCDSGEIYRNGTPIQKIPVHQYRQTFSTLFQDFCIYAVAIEKNVAMDEEVEEARARDAVSQVGLCKVIPNMHTVLTRELSDEGISFSGGELQRLALSRVLYENHDVLIMDEPTSAMDVVFEKQFYDSIFHQFRDKTILFVSHRLTSAVICDRILYMENGRIMESGSHQQLMKQNGGYARLFRAQAEAFQ